MIRKIINNIKIELSLLKMRKRIKKGDYS